MPYGTIKVDTVTFTDAGVDKSVSISGLVQNPTFSGNVTVTGTISGVTVTGTTASFTSGNFTNISGGTHTITSGVFATGSAANPSISFTSDPNTGIYSPGADQVTISTSGSGRVFVDQAGNVSVGTSTNYVFDQIASGRPLVVAADSSSTTIGASTAALAIVNNNTTTSNTSQINFAALTGASANQYSSAIISAIHGARVNGQYPTGALVFSTSSATNSAPTEKLRITSDGKVGLGTSAPGANLDLVDGGTFSGIRVASLTTDATIKVGHFTGRHYRNAEESVLGLRITSDSSANSVILGGGSGVLNAATNIQFYTAANSTTTVGTQRMIIDSSGRVGIGTTSPNRLLEVSGGSGIDNFIRVNVAGGAAKSGIEFSHGGTAYAQLYYNNVAPYDVSLLQQYTTGSLILGTNDTERARIDSSGRLLVGTSTARSTFYNTAITSNLFQLENVSNAVGATFYANANNNSSAGFLLLGKSRGTSLGSNTAVQSGDIIGSIVFAGSDGTQPVNGAEISAQVDGAPGTNDMPCRIVFATTADGGSSPTERMRINNQGSVSFIKTVAASFGSVGVTIYGAGSGAAGSVDITRDGGQPLAVNRLTNDGTLIEFYKDTTLQGNIAVSGSTVSYNGAHLSRWSQLPGGAERTEILRGTVLSNIDEMCAWGEEDNEQLNRIKVSDVEGDPNVAGVFQAWDDDDDTYTDDFYCAMTGDFIIRIAEGVTVQRGDLLISAGDGTAKPQDDDIIRSKTIAKVTSTHVICTYDDGSYCVPCVLMAC